MVQWNIVQILFTKFPGSYSTLGFFPGRINTKPFEQKKCRGQPQYPILKKKMDFPIS